MNAPRQPARSLTPFLIWLAVFYVAWAAWLTWRQQWWTAAERWPTALAMVLGSFFAGSTPVGGGSIAFPILTLLLGEPPALGRSFSFAIQSLGMTSAALYLWCTRRPVAANFLRAAVPGALLGTPIGCVILGPQPPDVLIRILFAVVWAGFGVAAITHLRRAESAHAHPPDDPLIAFLIGLIGGAAVAAVIGAGLDMLAFAYLVLIRRLDPRLAVPTGMVLMACASIAGIITTAAIGGITPGTLPHWLAAAPIVVIGAPLGALVVMVVPRRIILSVVALLCLGQFIWMCADQRLPASAILATSAAVLAIACAIHLAAQRFDQSRIASSRT